MNELKKSVLSWIVVTTEKGMIEITKGLWLVLDYLEGVFDKEYYDKHKPELKAVLNKMNDKIDNVKEIKMELARYAK